MKSKELKSKKGFTFGITRKHVKNEDFLKQLYDI